MTWRLDKSKSGSGSLGDIGAHSIDAAQWITGQSITGVSALLETFVPERPLAGDLVGLGGHGDAGQDAPRGTVTVDDAAIFSARFDGGAAAGVGVFEATRYALGRKNAMRLELNGTKASLAFDFEDMNALSFYDAAESPDAGFRRIFVTEPEHPYVGNWWPTGHGLGYEHGFTHQVVDLVNALCPGHAAGTILRRCPAGPARAGRRRGKCSQLQPMAQSLEDMTAEQGNAMTRPITLFTGQWADLPVRGGRQARRRVGL